jgi:hypothetical protein
LRFCELYRSFEKTLSVTMRQTHAAGERLFVDYDCDGVPLVIDRLDGESLRRTRGKQLKEAQAPECGQIMASSPKPPRGEPEFRSTTDCRRPPDIVASPSRGRPSNRRS